MTKNVRTLVRLYERADGNSDRAGEGYAEHGFDPVRAVGHQNGDVLALRGPSSDQSSRDPARAYIEPGIGDMAFAKDDRRAITVSPSDFREEATQLPSYRA